MSRKYWLIWIFLLNLVLVVGSQSFSVLAQWDGARSGGGSLGLMPAGLVSRQPTLLPGALFGLSFTVDSTQDAVDTAPGDGACATSGGVCTLRAAIMESNVTPGLDHIILPAGTYSLAIPEADEDASLGGDLDVLDELTITGAGSEGTVVNCDGLDGCISVLKSVNVHLSGLTLQGSGKHGVFAMPDAGYMENIWLTLSDCVVETASEIGVYGFAFNVNVTNSVIRNSGTGINIEEGAQLVLHNSTVCGNQGNAGAGIHVWLASAEISHSTVSANIAPSDQAGGGIHGDLAYIRIINSTITGNQSGYGGGVYLSEARADIYNSTIAANLSESADYAAGLHVENAGAVVTVTHTIIANSNTFNGFLIPGFDGKSDCSARNGGVIISTGYNLIGNTSACALTPVEGDIYNTEAKLASFLMENGGPTSTLDLMPGSPAIDAGNPSGCRGANGALLPADQRGVARSQDGDGDGFAACDIGAVEADQAFILTVNSTVDAADATPGDGICAAAGGECTLRAAVMEASASPGNDTVVLPTGIYLLSLAGSSADGATGGLWFQDHGTLVGSGAPYSIVDGNQIGCVFSLYNFSAPNLYPVDMTISGVTIRNGIDLSGYGNPGGIYILGNLALYDSQVINHQGSGIRAEMGNLSLVRTVVSGNQNPGYVGGIIANMAYLEVISSTVSMNTGGWGGISADWGFTMVDSSVYDNTGSSGPGGMRIVGSGKIVNSTISGNTGTEGAGIWTNQGMEIYNSTITMNTATAISDTVFLSGAGGGIYYRGEGGVTISNTLLAANSSSVGSPDCSGIITSGGYNLVGSTSGCAFQPATGDLLNVDPSIGPLHDNGGKTLTHRLLPSSPAVDAGNPDGCRDHHGVLLEIDQRGEARPQAGNGGAPVCDIGAYEVRPEELADRWVCWDPGNPNPCHHNLYAVAGDAGEAWAVGQAGLVLHWDSSQWEQVPAPTRSDLTALAVVAADDAWVAGGKRIPGEGGVNPVQGAMLHWDGADWTHAAGDFADAAFTALDMVSSVDGWAVADGIYKAGTFWHYDGIAWTEVLSNTGSVHALDMLSSSDGWAVGGAIWHWDGASWAEQATPGELYDLQMLGPADGWAVGRDGTILRWNGSDWLQVSSPTTHTLQVIGMASADLGWAAGVDDNWRPLLLAWDGTDWEQAVNPLPGGMVWDISAASPTAGWMGGQGGAILRWSGSAWEASFVPAVIEDLYGLDMLSTQEGWAVGAGGVKLHWDGSAWTVIEGGQGAGGWLASVSVVSDTYAWAVGESAAGSCVTSNWNGAAWQAAPCPAQANSLVTVDLASADAGWAAGFDTMLRWDGANWLTHTVPVADYFYWTSIDALSAGDVWAAGNSTGSGTILHWDGTAWQELASFADTFLTNLAMASPQFGWSPGISYPFKIHRYSNGQWTAVDSPASTPVMDISAVYYWDAWAVTGRLWYGAGGGLDIFGTMYHWDGVVWQAAEHPSDQQLWSIEMVSDADGWAVGANGVILRYMGSPMHFVYLPIARR